MESKITIKLVLLSLIMIGSAFAETSQYSIAHDYPFESIELPEAGLPIKLKAFLINSKSTNKKVKLLLVKDGVFSEIYPKKAYLNDDNVPEYTFSVHAPIAGMKYKFLVNEKNQNGDSTITSDEYSVARECISDKIANSPEEEIKIPRGSERLSYLVKKARTLETEIELFAEAQNLLTEVLSEINGENK